MTRRPSKKGESEIAVPDSDEHFASIIGYTEGGCPYGVTWEEHERAEARANANKSERLVIQENSVSLNDITQHMEFVFDELPVYFKRSTGEFIFVNYDGTSVDNWTNGEETPQNGDAALIDECNGDYVALPSRFDIHEYSIIETFCHTVEPSTVAKDLLRSISGKGAFRRFKDAVCRHSIEQDWYKFKDTAYRKIARTWCTANSILWRE